MKINRDANTLVVNGLKELDATNARSFQNAVSTTWRDGLKGGLKHIEVDLSETVFLDSCGLGALAWLRRLVADSQGRVCLINPVPSTQQLLDLTRLYCLFDIVKRQDAAAADGNARFSFLHSTPSC